MTSCPHVHNVVMDFILVMESVINVREIVNLVCLRVHVRNVMMVTFWCLLTEQGLVNVNYVTHHVKHAHKHQQSALHATPDMPLSVQNAYHKTE